MAYIRKRGKTWSYTVDVGRNPITNEREQETKGGFQTKKEAELAAGRIENDVADGIYTKETKLNFQDYAGKWLEFYASTGEVSLGSVKVRRTRINKLNSYFGSVPLAKITRLKYQKVLIDLKEKGLANETIISTHITAKLIFQWAVEMRELKNDPTRYAKVPRKKITVAEIENSEALPKFMEKDQLAHFLQIAKEKGMDKDFYLFTALAYTGLRIGEAVSLKWKDIDLEEKTISITKTYHNESNNTVLYELVPPKTKASIRNVEFDDYLKKIFENQRALLNIYKMKYRKKYYYDGDFVFPNLGAKFPGYPDVQKNPEARMKRLLSFTELGSEFTPHSLRHTHTTLLAEAGATLEETMERLGHKDDKTTRLIYLHVTKTMRRGAAQKFSNLMSNVVKM
ncbi:MULTISPECIES: site-specific integrase [Paenibacillus]|uniref:site-specific integrase n=1 Tax=Paenibacillus TaxID=44249 RepID=UPI00096E9FF1|nr:tyrosine-type recombinase/integrase [Paenibacillus odorifer]OME16883.1 site-specific integrase [Paenibacillus odorifer]